MRSSELISKSDAQRQMAKSGFGYKFMTSRYFEVGFFFHIPSIHYEFENIISQYR